MDIWAVMHISCKLGNVTQVPRFLEGVRTAVAYSMINLFVVDVDQEMATFHDIHRCQKSQ